MAARLFTYRQSKRILPKLSSSRYNVREFNVFSKEVESRLRSALGEDCDIIFQPLRVTSAETKTSFSNADVKVSPYITNERGEIVDEFSMFDEETALSKACSVRFVKMYHKGFQVLHSLLEGGTSHWDTQIRRATTSLCQFIMDIDFHSKCLSMHGSVFEEEKSVVPVLGNHLIGKLCGGDYIICNETSIQHAVCPCSVGCGERIKYGSTGLGHRLLWYGYPDMLAGPQNYRDGCMVVCVPSRTEADLYSSKVSEQDSEIFGLEAKSKQKSPTRHPATIEQIIAKAITFSFCKSSCQLRNPDMFPVEVSLIPTIAVTPSEIDIYMYDFNADILLRCLRPIRWYRNEKINVVALLQLWMLIHHSWLHPRFMMSELAELENTAGFQSLPQVKENISKFKSDVIYRSGINMDMLHADESEMKQLLEKATCEPRFAQDSENQVLNKRI